MKPTTMVFDLPSGQATLTLKGPALRLLGELIAHLHEPDESDEPDAAPGPVDVDDPTEPETVAPLTEIPAGLHTQVMRHRFLEWLRARPGLEVVTVEDLLALAGVAPDHPMRGKATSSWVPALRRAGLVESHGGAHGVYRVVRHGNGGAR